MLLARLREPQKLIVTTVTVTRAQAFLLFPFLPFYFSTRPASAMQISLYTPSA